MKTILLILFPILIYSQSSLEIGITQDARLLLLGDDKGNDAGTLNTVINFNMQGKQFEYYYFAISPQFEFANLKDNYYRYSVNGIWTFNRLIIRNFEAGIGIGAGIIHRDNLNIRGQLSYSLTGELSYVLNDNLKLTTKYELVKRSDLEVLYNDKGLKPNFYIGLKYKILNN